MEDYIYEQKIPYLSRKYKRLCKNNVITHDYEKDKNIIKRIEIDDNLEQLKRYYNEILLPDGFHCVIGRGMYHGYLVKMKCRSPIIKRSNYYLEI